jgi:hypothetical protein
MIKVSQFSIKYKIESQKNNLTSFGGSALFLEFLKAINFDQQLDKELPDFGSQGYSQSDHVLTLILLNLLGGESVSDVNYLENDSGLKRIFQKFESSCLNLKKRTFRKGRERRFPGVSSIFDFLDSFNSPDEKKERDSRAVGTSKILPTGAKIKALQRINEELISKAQILSPQQNATLDMDNQFIQSSKSNAEYSYHKKKGYSPFNVYWAEQDLMIWTEFSDGNVPPGKEQLRLFLEAERQLPSGIKQVYHRSDTAGYQHEHLEKLNAGTRFGKVLFAVSAKVSKSFRKAALEVEEKNWIPVFTTTSDGQVLPSEQEIAEITFTPSTKNHQKNAPLFRYIAIREATTIQIEIGEEEQLSFLTPADVEKTLHLEKMNEKAYKIFGMVSNFDEQYAPLEILLWQRKRCGNSEQEHSRLTKDLAGGRFPSDSFGENTAWWQIVILSLNLLKLFQKHTLPRKLKRARIKTLNKHFLHIATKVLFKGRQLILKIQQKSSFQEILEGFQWKIQMLRTMLSSSNPPPQRH